MIDIAALRTDLGTLRAAVEGATATALAARRTVDQLMAAAVEHPELAGELSAARNDLSAARSNRDTVTSALHDRLASGLAGSSPDDVIGAFEHDRPVALLPVRIETAFVGPDNAPLLRVRIYPDELHVEQHEPELSASERDAGHRYWTAIVAGAAEADAWAALTSGYGSPRASWIRTVTTPEAGTNPPVFPGTPIRTSAWSRPAVASTLPDQFVIRVRAGSFSSVVATSAVRDRLPMGIDPITDIDPGQETNSPSNGSPVLALTPDLRWMVDFDDAVTAGLGIEIALPAGTQAVDDVTVVGGCVSLAPDVAAERFANLIAEHRYTGGAGFVEPGTPTNNLADSVSGADASSGGDGSPVTTNLYDLAAAFGLGRMVDRHPELADLPGGRRGDAAEGGVMQRVLFEATWGPYLRELVQPGFPLERLGALRAHVADHVRGGPLLPTLRLGRQPYGVVPILPLAAWQPDPTESGWVTGLVNLLRRVRPLWTSAASRTPSGVAALSFEAVSSRVRVRTPIGSMTRTVFDGLDLGGDRGGIQERRLLAELGIDGVRPIVASQFFAKDAPNLWLPMATSDSADTTFSLRGADPTTATSVLGLLLRDTALRLRVAIGSGILGGIDVTTIEASGLSVLARSMPPAESLTLPASIGQAVSFNPALTTTPRPAFSALADQVVTRPDGSSLTIAAVVDSIIERHPIRIERYNPADALAGFRDALAELEAIPASRRARLTGEALDCASHRYDAWATSIASRRLARMRANQPTGVGLGAWGVVRGIARRTTVSATGPALPSGTVHDPANGGHVLAPSVRHAATAGVLRAAWMAHGGIGRGGNAPFAVDLTSRRVRLARSLADAMRTGQSLGALLGYQLERSLHDASGHGIEIDWMVAPLRHRFPLRVDAQETTAAASSSRLVVDGWRLLQTEESSPGTVAGVVSAEAGAAELSMLGQLVAELNGTLDALADLGLAEATYQLGGRNFERAAAATDMIGRATLPPDDFDGVLTPRPAHGIDQRVIMTFTDSTRPTGWATDTVRTALAIEADAFVARCLGPADRLVIRAQEPARTTSVTLADTGLSALDVAADAALVGPGDAFGPLLDAAVRRHLATVWAAEMPDGPVPPEPVASPAERAAAVALLHDRADDAVIVHAVRAAAAWHRALAGRDPLTAAHVARPHEPSPPATAPAALAIEVDRLAAAASTDGLLDRWGLTGNDGRQTAERRVAEARGLLASGQWAAAAKALVGSDVVLTGSIERSEVTSDITDSVGNQGALVGGKSGVTDRWLQDSARVREAIRHLDDAYLLNELAPQPSGAGMPVGLVAQSPRRPYAAEVASTEALRWVGDTMPAPLSGAPIASVVVQAAGGWPNGGPVVGMLVDRWTEAVPELDGTAGVAANIPAPDARPPNAILLAVPAALDAAWTTSALFATVDEAVSLAECRLVDFDAVARIPAILPAIYVEEGDLDDFRVRPFLKAAHQFPHRWTTAVAQP